MSKKKIVLAFGTRPELIRFAPIIHDLISSDLVELCVVHTGQHFSENMNDIFFRELDLPKPNVNLSVGGLSPNDQVGQIIIEMGKVIDREKPDGICVWGDTNSSLGVAIAANKKGIRLFHVEAGCRSYDFRMAEEYNRILIDHLSDILFPLSQNDYDTLFSEKVHGKSFFFGDPLYDVFLENQKKIKLSKFEKNKDTALLTLHRAENVDNRETMKNILSALTEIKGMEIIFPVHPRTKKMIESFGLGELLVKDSIKIVDPLGYLELLEVLGQASVVITDSGGLQKEAFFAKKTCITLRKSTEWLDTVKLGVNILLDPEKDLSQKLPEVCQNFVQTNSIFSSIKDQPYGDGHATEKIIKELINQL